MYPGKLDLVEIRHKRKIPKGQKLKSVPTASKQTKTEASFVAKCTWKRTDANENNFSLKKQTRKNSGRLCRTQKMAEVLH